MLGGSEMSDSCEECQIHSPLDGKDDETESRCR